MRQITIIGVGLIGGSFALAVKQRGLAARVVGCDRAPVLARARQRGGIDAAVEHPEAAVQGSELVLLATPVGAILEMIERVGPLLPPGSVLADVGSTKTEIVARARAVFGAAAGERFVPGHPMAGKEQGGIEQAEAELFQGAKWIITPVAQNTAEGATAEGATAEGGGATQEFLELIEHIGARPMVMEAALHDRVCAWISHLPQMVSTALAAALVEEFREEPELLEIGGRALREMTRLGQSPYSMWRDIALTNTDNIQDALARVEQRLAHIRENLATRELAQEFDQAHALRKKKNC